jgi:mannitol/fructose-specific phosphotransferase system IIA component (Ntr-type)
MNISRYLDVDLIKLEMESEVDPPEEGEYSQRQLLEVKETILSELVDLMEKSGKVSNKNKLFIDLMNREKKASTGIGEGIAIPHVRTMQAREFIVVIGRNLEGYEFDSMDGEPVRLFFCMAAPPYDDNLYLKVFKELAERFEYPGFIDNLLSASDGHEIIRAFKITEQG